MTVGSNTSTTLIDGRAIARLVREQVSEQVQERRDHGLPRPVLATVLVGDDPASAVYVANKRRAARDAGMGEVHRALPATASEAEVAAVIDELADDPRISGILLQLPLPAGLSRERLIERIPVTKDVDGLTTMSVGRLTRGLPGLRPCTPSGVVELLDCAGVEIEGAHAVVVGHSELVGRPMAQLLLQRDATVTIAHSKTRDLAEVTRAGDIVVVATGVPGLIGPEHIKPGATVIDVGITRTERGIVGDVRASELDGLAARVTPVPGGVGPMTIAMLLVNTLQAAQWAASDEGTPMLAEPDADGDAA